MEGLFFLIDRLRTLVWRAWEGEWDRWFCQPSADGSVAADLNSAARAGPGRRPEWMGTGGPWGLENMISSYDNMISNTLASPDSRGVGRRIPSLVSREEGRRVPPLNTSWNYYRSASAESRSVSFCFVSFRFAPSIPSHPIPVPSRARAGLASICSMFLRGARTPPVPGMPSDWAFGWAID